MIKKVIIDKFRKLENISEELGSINELFGSNGTGKTTYINFISWMICGETDKGVNDDANLDDNNYYSQIGGTIICQNNEKEYIFKRVYGYDEDTNKRKNDFYVNDRKVKNQNEYYDYVLKCFDINLKINKIKGFNFIRSMIDPYYLGNSNNETPFRELITSLLNVDTNLILFSDRNGKYNKIKDDYENSNCDYSSTKDFYNQQLKKIESSIDSVKEEIKTDEKYSYDEETYKSLNNELSNICQNKINDSDVLSKEKELKDYLNKLNESIINDKVNAPKLKEQVELENLKKEYNEKIDNFNSKIIENNKLISLKEVDDYNLLSLNKEYDEVNSKVFKEEFCPVCKALINGDLKEEFNNIKANKLKELNSKIDVIKSKKYNIISEDKIFSMKNELKSLKSSIEKSENELHLILSNNQDILLSDKTKSLKNEYNKKKKEYELLCVDYYSKLNSEKSKFDLARKEIQDKIDLLNEAKNHYDRLQINKENKKNLLFNKSEYELRKKILEDFKMDELSIIKESTSKIFGNDFEFVLQEKQKSNDNYKKVCYAMIDGVKYSNSNSAQELYLGIEIIEKIKKYIGSCTLPIIFDISDNLGENATKKILGMTSNQIFYTRISYEDNIKRQLKIIKKGI